MKVRHWVGDAGLAILLALPTATLASPGSIWQSQQPSSAPHVQAAAVSSRFAITR